MTVSPVKAALPKITGVALIAGALVTAVGQLLHPQVADPNNVQQLVQKVAEAGAGLWTGVHLGLAVGLWLLAVGVAGLHRIITSGPGEYWVRGGFYGVMCGTTLFTAVFGIDGMGLATTVSAWQAAAAPAKTLIVVGISTGLALVNGLATLTIIVYWLGLALVGFGVARSGAFSSWLGWAIVVPSVLLVGLGISIWYGGNSAQKEMVFSILAILTLVWALVTGVLLLMGKYRTV